MDQLTRPESSGTRTGRLAGLKWIGIASGAAAAFCWAVGLAGARHGIAAGLSPGDLTLHRYAWLGPLFAIFVFRNGFARPGIMAHVIEEIEEGKPLRIVRDEDNDYLGPPERPLPPR